MTPLHFSNSNTNYRAEHNGGSNLGIAVSLYKEYENRYIYETGFFVTKFTTKHILNKYKSLFYIEDEEAY